MTVYTNVVLFLVLASAIYSGIRNSEIAMLMDILKGITLLLTATIIVIALNKKTTLNFLITIIMISAALIYTDALNALYLSFVCQLLVIISLAIYFKKHSKQSFDVTVQKIYKYSLVIVGLGSLFVIYDPNLLYFETSTGKRFSGFYGSPISWGYLNATLSILGIYLYCKSQKLIYVPGVFLTALLMIGSGTRSALLFCAIFFFFTVKFKIKIAILIIPTFLILLQPDLTPISKILRLGDGNINSMLSGRDIIWVAAYLNSDIQLLGGHGFKEAGQALFNAGYKGPGYRENNTSISIHNSYLDIILGMGALTLLVVITILAKVTLLARQTNWMVYAYQISYITANIFESMLLIPLYYPSLLFYFLTFYIVQEMNMNVTKKPWLNITKSGHKL